MERGKGGPGTRGPKSKITQPLPDSFIALGAKQSSSRDDSKRTVPLPKSSVSSHIGSSGKGSGDKLKREGTSSTLASVNPAKKIKVNLPGSRSGLNVASGSGLLPIERMTGGTEPWESLVVECDAADAFEIISTHINNDNSEKAVGYVLGLIKNLKNQRSKPCKVVYSVLGLVCSLKASIFTHDMIVTAMLSVLRRDVNAGLKPVNRGNPQVDHMFLTFLSRAYAEFDNWPEIFVRLYVEDAVGDRVFVDSPLAKPFVDNIITAFNTKMPPSSLLKSETWTSASRDTSSPLTINSIDEDDVFTEQRAVVESWPYKVYPRFTQAQEKVEQIVLEAIKEQLARRQQPETITKNFVRFLSTACGLVEIRIIAVSRIETWLHNHKLMKPAQELLAYLCYNCSANSQRDHEVISSLSKLRLKNKPIVNFFNNCLREMVFSFPENLYPLLKYTIYNELSNSRNTNNLIVVGAMFQVAPESSADAFADICLELLLNKDDYLRPVRALLKEINRVLRHELNLLNVVHSLLRERKDFTNNVRDHEFRERIFLSLADLSCMSMLLCVSPPVRDAANQSKRDVGVLKAFQMQVSNIQKECVTWLHDSALRIYRPSITDFVHVLHKVLFLEQAEHYYKVDNWPGENERNLFLRLTSEVPLLQTTLLRILLIGISKEHPITAQEAIDVCDQLIKRAANLPQDCAPSLVVDKIEIIDFFFNLCSYNYPENFALPPGYLPPKLAIITLYWRVWLMLLILAAHNAMSFGSLAWNKYPTLKMFMEMCITNHFSFPPPTMTSLDEDYQSKEQQILVLEKQTILEFESHLAAASTKVEINEQTSLLLPQCMELRPTGEARRPPQNVLDQLQILNNSHRLGHLLCRSRCPDFLLDIMSRQGGTAHMPWLAELVHSSEGVLAHLPVQCLCEYLLSTAPTEKLTKHGQLLAHLRDVVNGNEPQTACEVLEYLFRRLTSEHGASRTQATKGLCLILAPTDDLEVANENHTLWLTQYINQFTHFLLIKPILIQFLRQAVQIETNPARVSSYINFLSQQDCSDSFVELNELVTDLSSVIIERHSVASYVLPSEGNITLKNLLQLFYLYTQKAKENAEESYTIHESYGHEYVIVSWATGEQCPLQPVIIHATIVLLTYGPLSTYEPFKMLLNSWFPDNMEHPRAYSPDTSETTSYLPDWMKLRMIRSNVSQLVDAAIEKLDPTKLVLFIQSFGIPTNSISKLLHTLDKATILDTKLVVDNVLDKAYMIQLVEVQNKRGATGGETFVKAIEMQMPIVQDADIQVDIENKKQLPTLMKRPKLATNESDVVQSLNNLFNPHYQFDKNALILLLIKSVTLKKSTADLIFNFIKSIPVNYTLPVIMQYNSISTLIRLIFTTGEDYPDKLNFATQFLKLIPNKKSCIAVVLQQYTKGSVTAKKDIKMEVDCPVASTSDVDVAHPQEIGERLGMILLEGDNKAEKTGLIVDWLSAIELEIANSNKHRLQMELLFSKQKLQFRPLLMSLVLQRATWKILHNIMIYLLRDDLVNEVCPSSALDFLTALTKSPKLWQGRDKAIPKHCHFEDVLQLNCNQVLIMIKFIIEESKTNESMWKRKMESRLQLVLRSLGNNAVSIMKKLVHDANDIYTHELILMIYMSVPYSVPDRIEVKPETCTDIYNKNCPSAIDEISHCLLSALAATPRNKDWTKKSQELELLIRKLVATHPLLVLRQLPMLAGCLKGRAQYDWGVLKSRGHFMLFGQILGLMELLQPYIFNQTSTLCELLDSYFLLLQFHGQGKDLSVLVSRIVIFIQHWMVKDVKGASKYLQQYGSLLHDIQYSQPGVRPLLSSVSLPITDQLGPTEVLVGTVTPPVPESHPPQWAQLKSALQASDNLSALQELDHITSKRPQWLEEVSQYLCNSVSSPNSSARSLSLLLMIRWLKYNPKASSAALPAVLACIDSKNGDVVESVLERLPELVAVMQEYAKIILTRVFQLGVKSAVNTTSSITKSIHLLGLQYGC
ncbi:integrator complex subunit 1 [Diabrotica virgifera virgifera]|uniref:Integrator complex subunit 1 n=1 Tax=Diabrotica virgifera virgifera TaxID=50390 RepID=A0ABM5JP10_DIAVI|nr:integrator complex subunit 1 [Diabrotica virgifera virgifera]